MKLSLYEIVAVVETLSAIKEANEIQMALAWEMEDFLEGLQKPYKRFQEEKNKLVKAKGTPDPDKPEMYLVSQDVLPSFLEEMDKIGSFQVDLNGQPKLKKKDLLDADLKVPATVSLGSLKPFIE